MKSVKIHQIYYRRDQKKYLDAGFSPWSNLKNLRPELAESWVMIQAREKKEKYFSDLTGFLSWKFSEKTGLKSEAVLEFISSNPGYDCYIFNPLTLQTALFASVWEQGEHWHPGLKTLAQRLLNDCGIRIELDGCVDTFASTAYCNYFVAGARFWAAYFSVVRTIFAVLEKQRGDGSGAWQNTVHDNRPYKFIPFLLERCFGIVTRLNPGLRIIPYRYTGEKLTERTPGFVELIRLADQLKTECRDDRGKPAFREYLEIQREISKKLRISPDQERLLLR